MHPVRSCVWILAALWLAAFPAYAQGYCAQFSDGTSPDCSFTTLQMCEASVTGIGGVCLDNPSIQDISTASPPPLPLPPGQTSYQLFPAEPAPRQVPSAPPCNPVVDGTYCASAGAGTVGDPPRSAGMGSIQSISSDLSIGADPPATSAALHLAAARPVLGYSGECPAEGNGMRVNRKLGLSGAMLLAGISCAFAQQANSRSIEQYLCKDVMREHGGNRDVAIAFLQGFMLGKTGNSSFDLDSLHKQTSAFIEYCLDHPIEGAAAALAKVKN